MKENGKKNQYLAPQIIVDSFDIKDDIAADVGTSDVFNNGNNDAVADFSKNGKFTVI